MGMVFIFIALLIGFGTYGYMENKKSQNAPVLTSSVYLVRKFIISGDDGPSGYYGEFAMQDGKILKLDVKAFGYDKLPKSGSCVITYKYKTLLDFQYLGAIDEKPNDSLKSGIRIRKKYHIVRLIIILTIVFSIIGLITYVSAKDAGLIDAVEELTMAATLTEAYTDDGDYFLTFRTDGNVTVTYEVSEVMYRNQSKMVNKEGILTEKIKKKKFVSFVVNTSADSQQ